MMVRGICIRLIAPSCMRAPPEAVNTISGASCSTASRAAATMRLADRGAHRAAHELELHGGDHGAVAADGAVRDQRCASSRPVLSRASFSRSV